MQLQWLYYLTDLIFNYISLKYSGSSLVETAGGGICAQPAKTANKTEIDFGINLLLGCRRSWFNESAFAIKPFHAT